MGIDKKKLERQVDHVQYSLYAISMSCYVQIGVLEYYKVLDRRYEFGFVLAICIVASFGLRALRKLKEFAESETTSTEVLTEGTTS